MSRQPRRPPADEATLGADPAPAEGVAPAEAISYAPQAWAVVIPDPPVSAEGAPGPAPATEGTQPQEE